MKKKILALALAMTMAAGLMACGGSSSASSDAAGDAAKTEEAAAPAASSGDADLRLVNGKIEVDAALKSAAAAYEAETGVKVAIESMGGGVNIRIPLRVTIRLTTCPISLSAVPTRTSPTGPACWPT